MKRLKKILAVLFAVVLAVTFMPALPQGTVKAATAGGNTSYDKAQEINLREEVPLELKKEGDSYQTLYY